MVRNPSKVACFFVSLAVALFTTSVLVCPQGVFADSPDGSNNAAAPCEYYSDGSCTNPGQQCRVGGVPGTCSKLTTQKNCMCN